MKKLYEYLYYRLYSWNLKTWGKDDMPQFNAMFGVSFMMALNIGIILGILDILGIKKFIEPIPKQRVILFAIIIMIGNYFWLVHKRQYLKIAKKYKGEDKNKRLRNAILLWLYVIVSFVVISLVAILSGVLSGKREW